MGMPTPESNWKGFTESSLTGKAEYIADNTFMVVHGTGDDNVHVQHTMMLSKALVNHHIIFRQQVVICRLAFRLIKTFLSDLPR